MTEGGRGFCIGDTGRAVHGHPPDAGQSDRDSAEVIALSRRACF